MNSEERMGQVKARLNSCLKFLDILSEGKAKPVGKSDC